MFVWQQFLCSCTAHNTHTNTFDNQNITSARVLCAYETRSNYVDCYSMLVVHNTNSQKHGNVCIITLNAITAHSARNQTRAKPAIPTPQSLRERERTSLLATLRFFSGDDGEMGGGHHRFLFDSSTVFKCEAVCDIRREI